MKEQQRYLKPTHTIPGLSIEDRSSDLDELINFLEIRNIQTKNTRLDRYQKYLKLVSEQGVEKSDPKTIFKNVSDERFKHGLDWYLYVLREVDELAFILKGLQQHVPNGVDDRLIKIVGGSDFAALDRNTESRNLQFELRIASYFCLAGFLVDLSTDTDIVASKGRHNFYIECKRVSNPKQLEENLLKAKHQLLARMPTKGHFLSKCCGVIAVDVTKVAYPHNGLTIGVTNEHAKDVTQNALRKVSDRIGHVNFFSKKPAIIQCWLQIHIPGLVEYPPQVFTRFSSLFILNQSTQAKYRSALSLMHEATDVASLREPRETPPKNINRYLELPAGSELWLESEIESTFKRLSDPRCHKELYRVSNDAVGLLYDRLIGSLTVRGEKYDFSELDLMYFLSRMSALDVLFLEKKLFEFDQPNSRVELLFLMFLHKYPVYEG